MRALATTAAVIASALAVCGCGSSHPTPTTRASSGGGTPTTDIARNLISWTQVARASNRHFSIFPALPGKTHCAIPAGGVHLKPLVLHGTCQTSVRRRPTQEPSLSVTFTETWRRAACAPDLDVACSHRSLVTRSKSSKAGPS